MPKRHTKFVLLALAASVCLLLAVRILVLNFHLEGPPAKAADLAQISLPTSSIELPIVVPLRPISRHVEKTIRAGGPFLAGTLDTLAFDIVGKALGLPPKTDVKCEPTEAAKVALRSWQCFNDAVKKIERATRNSNPFSGILEGAGGSVDTLACAVKFGIDSIDSAFRASKACIDKVIPIDLPTGALTIKYSLALQSFDLTMREQAMNANAQIKLTLTPSDQLDKFFKGASKKTCNPVLAVSATIKPELTTDNSAVKAKKGHGAIGLAMKVGAVNIGAGQACAKNPNMQTSVFLDAIRPVLMQQLPAFLDNAIASAVTAKVNSEDRNTQINKQLSVALEMVSQSIHLTPIVAKHPQWPTGLELSLDANPKALVLGKPTGRGPEMTFAIAARAKPSLHFERLGKVRKRFVPVFLEKPADKFAVTLASSLSLDAAQATATQVAREIVAERLSELSIGQINATLYQAGERIVIGIDVTGVGWLQLSGSVFLTARPEFDSANDVVRLRDIKFDLDTSDFLLRRAAWILEAPIEKLLEERLVFSLSPQLSVVRETFKEFRHPLPSLKPADPSLGTLSGRLETMKLDQIWLDGNSLNVSGYASGVAKLKVATSALLESLPD